eukprot:Selendium_serpulae@DN5204_c2_g1_i11.p1
MAGPTSSGLNIQHEIVDVAADLLTEFYNQPLPQQRDEVVERIENEIVVMQQRLRRVAQLRSQQRVSAERRRRRETGDPFHSRSSSPSSDSSSEESDDEEDDSPSGGGAGPAPIAAYSYYVVMIQQLKRVIEVYRYERSVPAGSDAGDAATPPTVPVSVSECGTPDSAAASGRKSDASEAVRGDEGRRSTDDGSGG